MTLGYALAAHVFSSSQTPKNAQVMVPYAERLFAWFPEVSFCNASLTFLGHRDAWAAGHLHIEAASKSFFGFRNQKGRAETLSTHFAIPDFIRSTYTLSENPFLPFSSRRSGAQRGQVHLLQTGALTEYCN